MNRPSKKLLIELILIATTATITIGQVHADNSIKQKSINSKDKPASSIQKDSINAKQPIKAKAGVVAPKTKSQLKQRTVKPNRMKVGESGLAAPKASKQLKQPTAKPAQTKSSKSSLAAPKTSKQLKQRGVKATQMKSSGSAVSSQPALRTKRITQGLDRSQSNLKEMKELNRTQRLDRTNAVKQPGLARPTRRSGNTGKTNQPGNYDSAIGRGEVVGTQPSMRVNPGPKLGPKLGPKAPPKLGPKAPPKLGPKAPPKAPPVILGPIRRGSNGGNEDSSDGDSGSGDSGSDDSGSDDSGSDDSGSDDSGSDDSGSDDSGSDDSGSDDSDSDDSGSDDSGSDDSGGDDSGGDDADTEEGATEYREGGSSYNHAPTRKLADDFVARKSGQKNEVESITPEPCEEDDGSGRVAEPGPEGEENCVPGGMPGSGDDDDEEGSQGPNAENDLPVNEGISEEDRRGMVINPTGTDHDNMPDSNHALDTLEGIEGVINRGPGR